MHGRQLIENAAYGPEAVKVMGEAFDAAWISIAANFGDDKIIVAAARVRLANAVLSAASEDVRDVEALKNAALRALALDY